MTFRQTSPIYKKILHNPQPDYGGFIILDFYRFDLTD